MCIFFSVHPRGDSGRGLVESTTNKNPYILLPFGKNLGSTPSLKVRRMGKTCLEKCHECGILKSEQNALQTPEQVIRGSSENNSYSHRFLSSPVLQPFSPKETEAYINYKLVSLVAQAFLLTNSYILQ